MTQQSFEEKYKKLNPAQKKAVDTIEGPVMVIAGPGTGKTTILTLRIANILRQTDVPPDGILALTFTESGVAAIRQKLIGIVGSLAYRVGIHTFHSFANNIINSYPDHFENMIGRKNIDDLAQHQLVQDVINEGDFKYLRPRNAPEYYVGPCIGAIRDLKRENVSPA
ncbi:MAG: UvrD-helicase domain-containing protein, partial [Candidatus Taylorbacteria bacterium]|nr:UvrD-helicase domain-containing protein [Candidatus Taylorbacteria bacterium]